MPASSFMPEIEVAIAFNAGYATAAVDRVWTVVDDYVEAEEHIKIDYGRADEHSQVSPSTLSLTLDNRDSRFTPENTSGAYYPDWKRGRPVRVRARWPITTGPWTTLFTGYLDTIPVQWPDGTDAYSSVTITASSRQARLGRGATFKSIVEEEILYDSPVLYYPLGEPSGSTTAGNIAPGRSEILTVTQVGSGGTLTFGAATGPPTDDLTAVELVPVNSTNGLFLSAKLIDETIPTGNRHVEIECDFLTSSTASQYLMWLQSTTQVGGLEGVLLAIAGGGGGQLIAVAYANNGAIAVSANSAGSVGDGNWHKGVAKASLDGSNNVTVTVITDGTAVSSSAVAWPYGPTGSPTFLQPTSLHVGGSPAGQLLTGSIAHAAVYTQATTAITTARFAEHATASSTGFEGERSDQRIARYARLAGIPTAEINA